MLSTAISVGCAAACSLELVAGSFQEMIGALSKSLTGSCCCTCCCSWLSAAISVKFIEWKWSMREVHTHSCVSPAKTSSCVVRYTSSCGSSSSAPWGTAASGTNVDGNGKGTGTGTGIGSPSLGGGGNETGGSGGPTSKLSKPPDDGLGGGGGGGEIEAVEG